jgi:ElaA protein
MFVQLITCIMDMNWVCKSFNELTKSELYKIIQLRIAVFCVEQNCPYQDCDDRDQESYHFMAWHGDDLVAYTRLLPPGLAYKEPSIGRVVTSASTRGTGLGKQLMKRSMEQTHQLFNTTAITISAQLYLKAFYESFGFRAIGEPYLEDNILHIKMKTTV